MKGFGLIETIVALGIFSIIIVSGTSGFIPALRSGQSSREMTQASGLATEGLEAVRSIRDRSYNNLSIGTFGIGISSNLWIFSGSSDANDKFLRQIIVAPANRDSGGSLVDIGITDPDSFVVTSKVSWNQTIGDTRSISVNSVFTNWRKTIASGLNYEGLILYSDGTSTPLWRSYSTNSDTFGVESTLPSITGNPRNFVIKTSPTKYEATAAMLSTDGKLYVYCFDGTTWSQDWSVTIGAGTTSTKPFDVAYEQTSGKSIVLYSTNVATTNELNYRTKSGSLDCGSANWTAAAAFDPIRTSDKVSWVKLARNPVSGSNLIAASWIDWNKDLSAAIWDGNNFQNEMTSVGDTKVEAINTGNTFPDVESFDIAYESLSGNLMTIWGTSSGANGTNGVRYRRCNGNTSTCTWSAVTTPPTWSDDATNLDLSANPISDEMAFASIGNAGSDLQIGYWSGSAWTNRANVDTSSGAPLAGTKLVATTWLNLSGNQTYITVYTDSAGNGISWYRAVTNGVPVVQPDYTTGFTIGYPKKWLDFQQNPLTNDRAMLTVSDFNSDLFAKRIVMTGANSYTWSNSDVGTTLEANLGQSIVKPFSFAYWK